MNHRRHFYAHMVYMLLTMVSLAWNYSGKAVFQGDAHHWTATLIWSFGAIMILLVFPQAVRDISRASQSRNSGPVHVESPGERRFNQWSNIFSPLSFFPLVGLSLYIGLRETAVPWQFKAISIFLFLSCILAAGIYAAEGWRGYKESRRQDSPA
jgi:hypothetical protein